MSIELNPIYNSFAREVHGINLWELVSGDVNRGMREALCEIFCEHPVLVFRRQSLTENELLALGNALGSPTSYIEKSWHSTHPEISIVSNMRNGAGEPIGGLSSRELNWHTDQSYNARPITGCLLYAQVVPADGGRTSWASLYGAYEALPSDTREFVDQAVGIFSYAARTGAVITGEQDEKVVQQSYAARIAATPDVKHPLVHTHPLTRRKALYIDPGTLIGIEGMAETDCSSLIEQLTEAATRDRNLYHHHWQIGDLVLWDNAVTLHRRDAFDDQQSRLLKRMIIAMPEAKHIVPPHIH